MKHKKRRPKGMLPKKRRMYQNGGGVGDPPQGTITPQEALMRALQPENQFRLTGGDAPFRTITEEKDRMTAETVDDSMFEAARFLPVIGEGIDAAELAKVAATGEDFYGEEQDPAMFAGLTAAGYLIPNILEKPLKSAWRAIKNFPAKMPKKEFRELMGPEKEGALANLALAHREVYDAYDPVNRYSNVRQLPSLMSGSKLENAVGKDGMIQVSQIENLINSKDISAAEREALQGALFRTRSRAGYAAGLEPGSPLPDKIDYLSFKRAGSDVVSTGRGHATFFVDESKEYADYGLDELNLDVAGKGRYSASGLYLPDIQEKARTKIIRTTDPELQSTEYGHFGSDVIGHYRTFERPDEKGVLYISELQSDPLQARGPAGKKEVSLNIGRRIDDDVAESHIQGFAKQSEQARLALAEIGRGGDPSPFLDKMDVEVLYRTIDGVPYYSGTMRGDALKIQRTALGGRRLTPDTDEVSHTILNYKNEINPEAGIEKEDIDEILKPILENIIEDNDNYIKTLKGGYRGGANAKQANLIKNQDQFLISHILEQEAKGADKLRFPTGETTAKIQSYGDIKRNVQRAQEDVDGQQEALNIMMVDLDTATGKEVPSEIARHVDAMGLSGVDPDKTIDFLGRIRALRNRRNLSFDAGSVKDFEALEKFDNDALKQAYKEIKEMTPEDRLQEINSRGGTIEQAAEDRAIDIKESIHQYGEQLEAIKTSREHLSRVNASTQATAGIMKGYDRLPKALKKHGLDATKVTDDVGNTWWEVDIPVRLGEGVGEIRAYRKGGKFRILKK